MEGFGDVPTGATVEITPLRLHISDNDIDNLKTLIEVSKIGPATRENSSSKFGITREWTIEAKDHWLNAFDWRACEQKINSFPNFETVVEDQIQGHFTIHFAALFSKKTDAVPVLALHGWPGSFMEFLPIMTLLAQKYNPETLPYHIIVPSLPGYCLSDGPPGDKHFDLEDLSRVLNQFMINLGFGKRGYIAHGGDVGSFVARHLVTRPECKAIHVNMMLADPKKMPASTEGLTVQELDHLERLLQWHQTGTGYAVMHGTRPGTVGMVLSSSPLALLSWIGEKFLEWADDRQPLHLNTILMMTSLYWLTDTLPRCLYIYREPKLTEFPPTGGKPFGYSRFPAEPLFMPAAWCKLLYPNITLYDHDKGGHFAALEQPDLLLEDIETFVSDYKHLSSNTAVYEWKATWIMYLYS